MLPEGGLGDAVSFLPHIVKVDDKAEDGSGDSVGAGGHCRFSLL